MKSYIDRFLGELCFLRSGPGKLVIGGFLVCFALLTFTQGFTCGAQSSALKKSDIESSFKSLSIPAEKEGFFVDSFWRGQQENLLVFEGSVGIKALLDTLGSKNISSDELVNLLDIFGEAIGRDLPVYVMTSTSIRLLHKGASIGMVAERVREELQTIQEISDFVRRQDLKLTAKQRPILINALAESVELFVGKTLASSEVDLKDQEKLRQTVNNSIKYTSLPVNLSSGSGVKGSSKSEEATNEDLSGFLKSSETLGRLTDLALEIGERRK